MTVDNVMVVSLTMVTSINTGFTNMKYYCDQCESKFPQQRNLIIHVTSKHECNKKL